MRTERLDARRVAEVETEHLDPVATTPRSPAPARSACAASRGNRVVTITRCARAEQLERRLVADLHPAAGEQRGPPAEVRRLGALGEVEIAARRAELVVEVVDLGRTALAHVAVPLAVRARSDRSAARRASTGPSARRSGGTRREHVRASGTPGDDGARGCRSREAPPASRSDPLGLLPPTLLLRSAAPGIGVRVEHVAGSGEQPVCARRASARRADRDRRRDARAQR